MLRILRNQTVNEITESLGVSKTFVKKVIQIYGETRGVEYEVRARSRGRPRSIVGKINCFVLNVFRDLGSRTVYNFVQEGTFC